MADTTNNELLRAIHQLTKVAEAIGNAPRTGKSSSSSSATAGSRPGTAAKSNNQERAYSKAYKETVKSAQELADTLGDTDNHIQEFSDSLRAATKSSSKYFKTIFESDNVTNRALDGMRVELEKASNGLGGMVGSMIKSSTSIDDVKKQFDLMNFTTEMYNKILTKANSNSLTGIKSTSEMNAAIEMFAHNMDDIDTAKAIAGAEAISNLVKMKEEIVQTTDVFEKGALAAKIHNQEVINETVEMKASIAHFRQLEKNLVTTAKGAKQFQKTIDTSTKLNNAFNGLNATIDATANKLGIAEMFTLGGSFALLNRGVAQAYTQFIALAKAGGAANLTAWWDSVASAVSLGVSADKLAAVMTDGARQMAQLGKGKFMSTLEKGQLSLMQLGLSTDEAIEGVLAFSKTAQLGGVDIRNTKNLDNSIKQQTKNFKNLSAMTGITLKQFDEMNNSLLSDNNMRTSMMRTSISERSNRLQEISLERERLVTMGASNEQAQQMIKATNDVLQMKVKDRLEAAAKIQQAAGITGMGAEGAQAANIMRKGSRATQEEKSQLADFSASLKGRMETMAGEGGLGMENLMDVLDEGMPGAAKELLDAGLKLQQAADAQMGLTTAEKQKAIDGKGMSGDMARLGQLLGIMQAAITSPLFLIVAGIGGIALTLARWNMARKAKNAANSTSASVRDKVIATDSKKAPSLRQKYNPDGSKIFSQSSINLEKTQPKTIQQKIMGMKGVMTTSETAIPETKGGKGILGKAAKAGSGLASGLGAVAKFFAPVGALMAVYGAFEGWTEAADTFATDTATTGQKVSSAIGGAVESLTFGLLDGDSISTGIYDVAGWVTNKFAETWTGIKTLWETKLLPTAKMGWDVIKDLLLMPIRGYANMIAQVVGGAAKLLGLETPQFIKDLEGFANDDLKYADMKIEAYQNQTAIKKLEEEKKNNEEKNLARISAAAQRDATIAAKKAGTAAKEAGAASKEAAREITSANILHKSSQDAISAQSLITESQNVSTRAGKINVPTTINTSVAQTEKQKAGVSSKNVEETITKTVKPASKNAVDSQELLSEILAKMTELVDIQNAALGINTDSETQRRFSAFNGRNQVNISEYVAGA